MSVTTGCGTAPNQQSATESPLAGRVYDVRARTFIPREDAIGRAIAARYVILGEIHDNPVHHHLQADILASMIRAGRRPALAMEQFDREHQAALDATRSNRVFDPEAIADAGRFDRKGWRWQDYKPLVALAADSGLRIVAANVSREEVRAMAKSGRAHEGLPPVSADLRARLEEVIVAGHCGYRPPAPVLAGMLEAQRARDAQMAAALEAGGDAGTVLIAGAGHARRSHGAPAYVNSTIRNSLLVIAFIEVDEDRLVPAHYLREAEYDVAWFTPRAPREDPCAAFRTLPGNGTRPAN